MDVDPFPPTDGTIHVWRIVLGDVGSLGPATIEVLDASERARMDALRSAGDRAAYGATHAVLRQLLGRALDLAPAAVPIEHAPCTRCGELHGKPRLAGTATVHFNISHCRNLALVAITTIGEVGIDVEMASAAAGLAESADVFAGPGNGGGDRDLLRLWTRKEAVLKASGEGLTVDPVTVTIAADVDSDAGSGRWRRATMAGPRPWWVTDLELGPDHVGAIACPDPAAAIALQP